MDYEPIYALVGQIPRGKVTTYGAIARCLGLPSPRVVGRALHLNPDSALTPCHRVVNAAGRLAPSYAFGGAGEQAKKLAAEGVTVQKDRIDLKQFGWDPGFLTASETDA